MFEIRFFFCISLSLVIVSHLSTVRWLRKHRVEWSIVQDFPSTPLLNFINLNSTQPFNLCCSDMNWLITQLWMRLLLRNSSCVALKKNKKHLENKQFQGGTAIIFDILLFILWQFPPACVPSTPSLMESGRCLFHSTLVGQESAH